MEYLAQKQIHQKEIDDFPMFFAFSDRQLKEGIKEFGATANELCKIPGGGFIRKTDAGKLSDLLLRQNREREDAMKDDEFLTGAIEYELGNHEYCITHDPEPAMVVLGLDMEKADGRIINCFKKARDKYLADCEAYGWG